MERDSKPAKTEVYQPVPIAWDSADGQRFALLEAQVLYRMGLYREAKALYKQFYERDSGNHLIAANLQACRACLGQEGEGIDDDEMANMPYEVGFNTACVAIERGKWNEAKELLNSYEEQWRTNNSEEASLDPSDYQAIKLQRGYIYQLENRSEDALAIYKDITSQPHSAIDPTLLIVARNNLAVMSHQPSQLPNLPGIPTWFLSNCLRSDDAGTTLYSQQTGGYCNGISLRLSCKQVLPIISNTAHAMLKGNRLKECRRYLESFSEASSTTFVSQLKAQLELNAKQFDAAINHFEKASRRTVSDAVVLLMSALILALQSNRSDRARRIADAVTGQALVNSGLDTDFLILSLRLLQTVNSKRVSILCDEMKSALATTSDSKQNIRFSLNALAESELRAGRFQSAFELFNRLHAIDKDNPVRSMIGQLRSAAGFDFSIARKTMTELKSRKKDLFTNQALTLIDPEVVAGMPLPLDRPVIRRVAELLKSFSSSRILSCALEEVQKGHGYNQGVKSKKRPKRKPRYPKGFDPKNPGPPPDPERWLPKYERTTFKKTKRGNIKTFRGAQGVSNTQAGEIGLGKKVATTANVEIKKESTRRSGRRARH